MHTGLIRDVFTCLPEVVNNMSFVVRSIWDLPLPESMTLSTLINLPNSGYITDNMEKVLTSMGQVFWEDDGK